jgi:hypothetical protein
MRLRPAMVCHLLCLGSLRCASLLVPWRQRAEWWREWSSELWHVREACIPEHGISWTAEREVTAFCLGAFQDALCLRAHSKSTHVPYATTKGSAMQCVLLLTGLVTLSFAIALSLPGVLAVLHFSPYHDAQNLVLIRDANYSNDSVPTISASQYEVWKQRRQKLFDGFAFYRVAQQPIAMGPHVEAEEKIALATSNLFELLGLPVRFASDQDHGNMPRLVLSDQTWKSKFNGDPQIFGRVVHVGATVAVLDGVATAGSWRLPGKVDAWLLKPEVEDVPNRLGFVVAHLQSAHAGWGANWHMSAPKPDLSLDDFFCETLTVRTHGVGNVFLFAVLLACLALPATTSLPLGEYRVSSRKLSWSTRLRRWGFLCSKIALLLPIVYFVSLDLAHLRTTIDPTSSEFIQLVSSFSICLFGLRWTLRDQRQRCPVCLGKLTHPARVGQPSRSFLAWNGTELICISGHGLLHVPEMPTSWFSEQRWLYLDPSWQSLFAESGLASSGYF